MTTLVVLVICALAAAPTLVTIALLSDLWDERRNGQHQN